MSSLKQVKTLLVQSKNTRQSRYIKEFCLPALGIGMQNSYGWTISIPDLYQITGYITKQDCPTKKIKIRWRDLNPSQQIHYFRDCYFPEVVAKVVDAAVCVPEMNKAGNIHMHLLCFDKEKLNDYDLGCMRKAVHQYTFKIHGGMKNRSIHLNYLHFLKDTGEWISYLEKDLNKHVFPVILIKSTV